MERWKLARTPKTKVVSPTPQLEIPTETQNNSKGNSSGSLSDLIETAQKAIGSILALGAFLTASGFVVVNTHLSNFGQNFGGFTHYNVQPSQYLSAGVGLFVFMFVAYNFGREMTSISVRRALARLILLVCLIGVYLNFIGRFDFGTSFLNPTVCILSFVIAGLALTLINNSPNKSRSNSGKFAALMFKIPKSVDDILSRTVIRWSAIAVLAAIVIGMVYGQFVYRFVPRFLGGGRPENVALIFNKQDNITPFNFVPEQIVNCTVRDLQILIELTDGYLIQNTVTGTVSTVKKDLLLGMATGGNTQLLPPAPCVSASGTSGSPP
jgi:hypothetical protein